MKNNQVNNLGVDLNKSIEKNFRKYTLEVDDAIEAHGFRASSYIDYAENTIEELEHSVKKQVNEHGVNVMFENLENSLKCVAQKIVDHTKQVAYERSSDYLYEKIDTRTDELTSILDHLNTRFINSMENI